MTTDLQINIPFDIVQEEDGSNNWRRPDFANTYLAKSHPVIRGFFAAMEMRLRMAHEAFTSPSGDNKDIVTALNLFLQQEALELSRVCVEQGAMLRDHHSMATTFDKELCRMFLQKIFSAVFFSVAAAICAAVAAIAAANPRWTAGAGGAAAAATVVFVALGPGMHWILDKRRRPVKKRRETIGAMIGAEQLAMGYLRSACEWVSDLQSETVSVLGMVDGDEVAVRMKLAALNHSLQEVTVRANQYGLDVNSATEAALHTIITNFS